MLQPQAGPIPVQRVASCTLAGAALLAALLAGSPAAVAQPAAEDLEAVGGLAGLVELPEPVDAISPEQLAHIRAAIAAHEKRDPPGAPGPGKDGPFLYPFFPQAGVLGRDLFLNNFTDQNPSAGLVRDFDCTDYTYDGHQGHDSLIRSFREQAIGVPVFAALPGVVVDAHDGEPDMNTALDENNRANYVVIDHGGGYWALYFHFRRGSVAVAPGQAVAAGTQIGFTGSSGFTNWPHLHFETWKDGQWIEPSAGPCRTGDSLWAAQQPVARDFYVADFFLSRGAISLPTIDAYLLDATERTAAFVRGRQEVGERVDLRNLPAGSLYRLRVLTPRGKVAFEQPGAFSNETLYHVTAGIFWFDLDLNTPGTWRFQLEVNGSLAVDAPFRVVASARQAANRPPARVKTRLVPPRPVEGKVTTCEVLTSLVAEDPDYDVVSYRYEWKVNNRVARTVTSAALTDLLPAGAARARDRLSCRVTVSDGRSRGRAAAVAAMVEEGEEP